MARVNRPGEGPPVLDTCHFQAVDGDAHTRRTLSAWAQDGDIKRTPCTSPMDVSVYSLLLLEAPEVPDAELVAAIRWRVRDLIDFPADDAVVDVFDLPEQKATGRARMVYVVVARADAVRQHLDLLLGTGLKLTVIDIPELAQRNIAACLPEDAGGVALLSVFEDGGLITLTRQSTLYVARRLESGLETLGEAHMDYGEPDHAELSPRTQAWLDGLVIEVQRSLDYYESHFTEPPIGSLVIAPILHPVPGMADYLSSQLGLGVRVLDLNQLIDCHQSLDSTLQARCFTVIGAALRAA